MFRKILAIIIAVLIFSLVFLAVNFTKVEVPHFNRNLIMLAVVDIAAFGLVMWKFGCPMEKSEEEKEKRNKRLLQILEKSSRLRGERLLETTQEVLVEGYAKRGEKLMGKNRGGRKVVFEGAE